jgi:hypothetical protein
MPSLSIICGLPDPVQRSNYRLWRNMGPSAADHPSDTESLFSGYQTNTTSASSNNVSYGTPEAAPAGDRFSISDDTDDGVFTVGSDSDDSDDDEDANVAVAIPAQHRFVLSDSEEDSEGETVGMVLRVVNADCEVLSLKLTLSQVLPQHPTLLILC